MSRTTFRLNMCVVMTAMCCATAWCSDRTQPERETEEKKLGERLIRKAVADADEDIMTAIIRLMSKASRKLEVEFDSGKETQALQQRVIDRLDEAIKIAASQLRPKQSTQRPTEGDKRRMDRTEKKPGTEGADSQGEAKEDASSKTADSGTATTGAAGADASEYEVRRAWGHLPARQRDEVIQGIGEVFLERYRVWIERYYRALQETEE